MQRHAGRSVASTAAAHSVDLAFGLMVLAAFTYSFQISSETYFWADDLLLIRQAGSVSGLFDQYNGHLSLMILSLYRGLVEVFGFEYTPFRVAGLLSLVSIPTAYFITTRRLLGPSLAALLAIPLVWCAGVSLYPGELNHQLALLGGIGCAAALNRGPRADRVLAGALLFSLCSAGGGVAVAAACLAHNVVVRPALRRWIAVIVPVVSWGIWWLVVPDERADFGEYQPTIFDALRFAWDLAFAALESVALGNTVLAAALAVAFLGYAAWRLHQGLDAAANIVAWSAGLAAWGIGLSFSRGPLADVEAFRYQFPALGFILLALVPRRPIQLPGRLSVLADRRWLPACALAILLVAGGRALAVRSDLQDSARVLGAFGRITRAESLVIGLGESVVPDDTPTAFRFGTTLSVGEVRDLFDRYGQPFPPTVARADQALVDLDVVWSRGAGRRDPDCQPLVDPMTYEPAGPLPLYLWSDEASWTVDVRRFGEDWVPVGQGTGGQALAISLPALLSSEPWEVRAPGACQVHRSG